MTSHKIDISLTTSSEGEWNAFVTFDPSDAAEIMEMLAEKHIQIVRLYPAMGLCLIKADKTTLMKLAENEAVTRIAAGDDPVALEEATAGSNPTTSAATEQAEALQAQKPGSQNQ